MSGARRKALRVALVTVLAVLAVTIALRLAADVVRRGDAAEALAWDRDDPRSLDALASEVFEGDPGSRDLATIAGIARGSLEDSPLRSGAVRILGQVAERTGDESRARALIGTAAERWLYDLDAQIWVINAYLRSGEIDAALRHVDETLRARPKIWDEVLPGLVPLAVSREGLPPLTALLATSPTWRTRFLEVLSAKAEPMQPLLLYSALANTSAPPTDAELAAFLQRLITEEEYRQAYLVWVKFLPRERMATLGNVNNGGFDYPVSGLPFDWLIDDSVVGARISVTGRSQEVANLALHVEFSGRRTPFRNVSQMLLLSPGRYALKVSGRADALDNERGLRWTISCADGKSLGATETLAGTTGWKDMRTEFEVPAEACVAQRLRLELDARIPIEEQISGEIWFDDISVSLLKAASAS